MNTLANKIIVMSFIVACSFTSTNTLAEERFIEQDAEGFCTSLRLVEKIPLTQRIREWRAVLQEQHTALAERIEKLKFSALDTIITVVMPGGLLYAAVKSNNQLERRQDLTLLSEDIEQLSGDLHTLESTPGNLRIAALQE
ncbi:MAG: hypothetical protein ABFS39_06885 [Pseudomonadota bacterium]